MSNNETKNSRINHRDNFESPAKVETVLIIGLGMIGGSLAKALKENNFAKQVVGYDQSSSAVALGVELGVIDNGFDDIVKSAANADIIILAVPVKATATVLSLIKDVLRPNVLISDVGSTKGSVIDAARTVFGKVPSYFIPAHPIAGSEKSGVQAADSQLFVKHKVIITPHDKACEKGILTIARMWQSTGAEVLQMDVSKHDEVLAATSHLPHLLAFSLVDSLAKESASLDIFRYAAGGFRDFTRIAASDPTMWSDVCGANKQAILQQINLFSDGLANLKAAIEHDDEQSIKGIFIRARAAREHFGRMLEGTAYSKTNSANKNVSFIVKPGAALIGEIIIPGDKSISHRAIFFAALADGISHINGFLNSEDSMATIQAFRDMGVVIEGPYNGNVKVYGVGKYGLCAPTRPLYLGNSGTSMRLLTGLLAAQNFDSTLIGDNSLSMRPMERVAIPLRQMGARITTSDNGCAPIHIQGGQALNAIDYTLVMPSSQVKSSVLLAALYTDKPSSIVQPIVCRNHTELLMQSIGVDIKVTHNTIVLNPNKNITSFNADIPADFSSAAFFIVGAVICPGSDVLLKNIGINPTRIGLIHILTLMGAKIELLNQQTINGEDIADIAVQYSPLKAISIPEEFVSTAIDEFPVLFIAASCAIGHTEIKGLAELRFKETDRLAAMTKGLIELGITVVEKDDGVTIEGGVINGGCVDSQGDHRTAMAFAMAGLKSREEIKIINCANVASSFPEFVEKAAKAGLRIRKEETNVSK
jgi:3-phosphoshikimate 1-carboxyvinyltransferase